MITFALEDHLCRGCGGRILRRVTGVGVTPGGNPIYQCASCGARSCGMSPEAICWCGFAHRNNQIEPYKCLPFSIVNDYPKLLAAFRACGCEPKKGEVGIVLEADLKEAIKNEEST